MRKHAQQMFDTEIIGSHALREVCTPLIRIPQPIGTGNMSVIGNDNQGVWFLAEYVTVARSKKRKTSEQHRRFTQAIVKMHQTSAEKHGLSPHGGLFGFHVNNFYVHAEQNDA
ncbi:unnamed protein product [Rotaria magnacalcarata]|uniref:Uncharacterized protein n=2 Tax=Rotaria magnacalcarata TaxID=392030 RepID=A0A816PGQ5_9BILA|nr:unnamed protein product [Rotaria magnacalcarata]